MMRSRGFWIALVAWLLIGLPMLVATGWFRLDGLPIADPPRTDRGILEVIGWLGIVGLVYLTPLYLMIDEFKFRRSRRAKTEIPHAQD